AALGGRVRDLSRAALPFAAELRARDAQVLSLVELAGAAYLRRADRVRDRRCRGTPGGRRALGAAFAAVEQAAARAASPRSRARHGLDADRYRHRAGSIARLRPGIRADGRSGRAPMILWPGHGP